MIMIINEKYKNKAGRVKEGGRFQGSSQRGTWPNARPPGVAARVGFVF